MAPAAARTRPAWPAWTSVHASACHPDGRRHQRCLHRDHGYLRLDGCLVRLHPDLRQSLDGCLELRLRHLCAEQSRQDERHPERDGLRHPDRWDVRPERPDGRLGTPLRERPDVVHGAHLDVAPGRDCCRPDADAGRPREAGTGYCRPDGGAAGACRRASRRECHSRRCLRWQHRQTPGPPEVRTLRPTCWTGSRRRRSSRVRPLTNQQVPRVRMPRVRVPLLRVQRPAWALGDEVRPAWVRSPPWGSRVPERDPSRSGRPLWPCERRVLPVSRTVP